MPYRIHQTIVIELHEKKIKLKITIPYSGAHRTICDGFGKIWQIRDIPLLTSWRLPRDPPLRTNYNPLSIRTQSICFSRQDTYLTKGAEVQIQAQAIQSER